MWLVRVFPQSNDAKPLNCLFVFDALSSEHTAHCFFLRNVICFEDIYNSLCLLFIAFILYFRDMAISHSIFWANIIILLSPVFQVQVKNSKMLNRCHYCSYCQIVPLWKHESCRDLCILEVWSAARWLAPCLWRGWAPGWNSADGSLSGVQSHTTWYTANILSYSSLCCESLKLFVLFHFILNDYNRWKNKFKVPMFSHLKTLYILKQLRKR